MYVVAAKTLIPFLFVITLVMGSLVADLIATPYLNNLLLQCNASFEFFLIKPEYGIELSSRVNRSASY